MLDFVDRFIKPDHPCRAEVGDFVECITDKLKHYTKGAIYKVDKAKIVPHYIGHNKLRLRGFKTFITADINKFKIADKAVYRDANIDRTLGEEPSIVTTEKDNRRKIDTINKKYTLIELLINRITRDKNRIKYDRDYSNFKRMTELIAKGDRTYGIVKEDFEEVKDLTVEEMFNIFIEERLKK